MGNFNQTEGKFGVANWFLEVALEVALVSALVVS